MRMTHYILDAEHKPVPIDTSTRDGLIAWGHWFNDVSRRRVAHDLFCGGVSVSTVFLSLDHGWSFGRDHRPVLFETMIFGGQFDQEQHRYCTWREAESAHHSIADRVCFVEGKRGYSRSHWRKLRSNFNFRSMTMNDAMIAHLSRAA